MTFWTVSNINLWLLAGVIFSIVWHFYKAFQHDAEKHEERITYLESNQELIFKKLKRGIK
jgi:hypothetical protein